LPALTLSLEPLPEADARALAVAASGDRRLTDDEVAALMERAAGNPLFLRELASVGDKTEDAEDLPDTVETLVARRIDQLGPGDGLLRAESRVGACRDGPGLFQSQYRRVGPVIHRQVRKDGPVGGRIL
jgi:hypothetical protein